MLLRMHIFPLKKLSICKEIYVIHKKLQTASCPIHFGEHVQSYTMLFKVFENDTVRDVDQFAVL